MTRSAMEEKVYAFIIKFIKKQHYAPVYSEIAKGVQTSVPYARLVVCELVRRGLIQTQHRKARTIVVANKKIYEASYRTSK